VGRLNAILDQAKERGDLRSFNREFSRRRQLAALSRVGFMTYGQALNRYRALVASTIAGNVSPIEIMAKVFDDG
jgi:hypothetical protein